MLSDILPTALVMFREVLEIAIILCVILAATRGLPQRGMWVLSAIGLGLAGAGVIALSTERIAAAFADNGQEVLNAAILLLAAAMIGWTVVWMKSHGRQMSARMKALGGEVVRGETPARMLVFVVALAVFREGSEIVLFGYGLLASGASVPSFLIGAALGLAGGALAGMLIYFGLIKMGTKHLFTVTSWLLAFVAAGLAAKGAAFLVAANLLPEWGANWWNTSHILPRDSLVGQLLSVLIGYDDRPNGMQLAAYGGVLALIAGALVMNNRPAPQQRQQAAA